MLPTNHVGSLENSEQCGVVHWRIVATSPVVLRWLCDSPRTRCAWRIKL